MTLYLASTSPRRKKILRELGLRFCVVEPLYHEEKLRGMSPSKIVRRHATGKARSAAKEIKDGVIVSADTIVYFKGQVIGKPKNMKEAVKILRKLQGQWHTVYTGVTVLQAEKGKIKKQNTFIERTRVRLRKMGDQDIALYFKKIDPLDKAGAYAIQSSYSNIVTQVKGSFSNAVGLPKDAVLKRLRAFEG